MPIPSSTFDFKSSSGSFSWRKMTFIQNCWSLTIETIATKQTANPTKTFCILLDSEEKVGSFSEFRSAFRTFFKRQICWLCPHELCSLSSVYLHNASWKSLGRMPSAYGQQVVPKENRSAKAEPSFEELGSSSEQGSQLSDYSYSCSGCTGVQKLLLKRRFDFSP